MKLLLVHLFILYPIVVLGQSETSNIIMKTEYGSKNKELRELLRFENIDHYNVVFSGKELKGRNFSLISKTYLDGVNTNIDTIVNSKQTGDPRIASDSLSFSVTGKKMEGRLKVFFKFQGQGNERYFEAIQSDDYSMRDIGVDWKIKVGDPFPAFAYILPYERNGQKMYCEVDKHGKDINSWGAKFGIKHYIIFEIKFDKNF